MQEKDIVKEKYGIDETKFEGEFLKFESNKPVEVEFTPGSVKQTQKPITDSKTGKVSQKWFFEVGVDSINGEKVPAEEPKILSSTSQRLFNTLKPYMDGEESIYKKKFRIEKTGSGFSTQYTVVPKGERLPSEPQTIKPEKFDKEGE